MKNFGVDKMSGRNLNVINGTIQDVRYIDDRYVEPLNIPPTQSSLLKKTKDTIINFFDGNEKTE